MATRQIDIPAAPSEQVQEKQSTIWIFVLIDALGWRYIDGNSFLREELHYRNPLRTILGFSSGAIPTILTGVPPAENGHWNLFYYDPAGSPFRWMRWLNFLPDSILDHRVTRKLVKELGRSVLGLGPMFECHVSPRLMPWFNFIERKCIYKPDSISGAPSIFDQLVAAGVPYRSYSYHAASDEEILAQAKKDIASREAGFFFLYLSEMDAFLHAHCKDPDAIRTKLEWYQRELRGLFDEGHQIDPQARIAIFSDHGMTPVHEHFDLVAEVKATKFTMPQDYLAVYDSTMARFWFFNEQCRSEIENKLAGCTAGRILKEQELKKFGVYFSDHRYGELIFLLNPGCMIAKSDFNGKGWSPIGMHGYHPDDSYSDGVFLSNYVPQEPVHSLQDVYLTMYAALRDLQSTEQRI